MTGILVKRAFSLALMAAVGVAGCRPREAAVGSPAPATSSQCNGARVLAVQNGSEEAVDVYADNGRTSTLIGTVPPGKKEITLAREVRATSFHAVAVSRGALGGSGVSAPVDQRTIFQLECR